MSEEWYFGDDKRTSTEIPFHEPPNPVPFSSPAREPEIDDIFEGEPDLDILMTSGFDDTQAILPISSSGEASADLIDKDVSQVFVQWPQTPVTASGGLGPGDDPYKEDSNKGKYLEVPSEPIVADGESEYLVEDVFNLPLDLRHQTEQQTQQRHDGSSPRTRARNVLRRREDHLKELNGEFPHEKEHENCSYSSSASSESLSDDEYSVQPGKEEDQRNNIDSTTTSIRPGIQIETPKPPNTIEPDKNQSEPEGSERYVSDNASSSASNIHSSFLHSRSHLSKVTPADVQGHHPSIIARSPRKGMSRTSSGASDNGLDIVEQSQPLAEPVLREKDLHSTMEASRIFQSHLSPLKIEPHLNLVADDGTSLFRRPEAKRSSSSNRASPLRRLADILDEAGTLAASESPITTLPAVPSRPDTPRPFTEPERLGVLDHLHARPASPSMCALDQVKQIQAQYDQEAAAETLSRISERIVTAETPPSALSPRLQTISGDSSPDHMQWQESHVAAGAFDQYPPQAQCKDSSRISSDPKASASPEGPIPESTSAPPAEDSSLSKSPTGWQCKILCKRTTPSGRTARRDLTNTRGRAASSPAKKERAGKTNGNPSATGVQGVDVKVTKPRPKKAAANTGRIRAKRMDESKRVVDDIPEVPKLPESLPLRDSEMIPRSIKLKFSVPGFKKAAIPNEKGVSSPQHTSAMSPETTEQTLEDKNSLQPAVEDPSTPPSAYEDQLKVCKTRKPIASTEIPPVLTRPDPATSTTMTPEFTRMDIDTTPPVHGVDQLQHQAHNHNQENEPTTPSVKRRSTTRKQTPGRIQKSTVRKPKIPARIPTLKPNQIADLLETSAQVEQSKESMQTPPAKTKPAPRKATPLPRKRKQDKKVLDEVIPPVPTTPKRIVNNGAGDGRLIPQSAERGQPETPLRRSPRLSGIEPGPGL